VRQEFCEVARRKPFCSIDAADLRHNAVRPNNSDEQKMKKTLLALAIAPATAGVAFGVLSTVASSEQEPIVVFIGSSGVGALVSYGLSYTVGIAAFCVLRALKRETTVAYVGVGALLGLLYAYASAAFAPGGGGWSMFFTAPALGMLVASTFAFIRGSEKIAHPAARANAGKRPS
jgi:hypothetical protein